MELDCICVIQNNQNFIIIVLPQPQTLTDVKNVAYFMFSDQILNIFYAFCGLCIYFTETHVIPLILIQKYP